MTIFRGDSARYSKYIFAAISFNKLERYSTCYRARDSQTRVKKLSGSLIPCLQLRDLQLSNFNSKLTFLSQKKIAKLKRFVCNTTFVKQHLSNLIIYLSTSYNLFIKKSSNRLLTLIFMLLIFNVCV